MVGDTSPAVDAVVGVHYLHGNTVKNESGDLILIQSIFRDDTGLSKDEGLDSKLSELPLSHLSLSPLYTGRMQLQVKSNQNNPS